MPLGDRYDERHFIEELGLLFAAIGTPRMMGHFCQAPWDPIPQNGESEQGWLRLPRDSRDMFLNLRR